MSVTNLTGTEWVFNDDISEALFEYMNMEWNISFTANNTNYTSVSVTVGISIFFNYGDNGVYGGENPHWFNNANRSITITGGTDVENSDLISFIESCAIPNVYYKTDTWDLTRIADAIRDAGQISTQLIYPNEYVSALGSIGGIVNLTSDLVADNPSFNGNLCAFKDTTTGNVYFSIYSTSTTKSLSISSLAIPKTGMTLNTYVVNASNVGTTSPPMSEYIATIKWNYSTRPYSIIGSFITT